MKTFALILLLSVTSAFAGNICEFKDTYEFTEKVEAGEAKHLSTTVADKFSRFEEDMIFDTMKRYSKGWRTYDSVFKAVWDFSDKYEECSPTQPEPGSNAGEVAYYEVAGKKIALVHFWPGDNEYGSIYEIKNGKFTFVAVVQDGEIYCK